MDTNLYEGYIFLFESLIGGKENCQHVPPAVIGLSCPSGHL